MTLSFPFSLSSVAAVLHCTPSFLAREAVSQSIYSLGPHQSGSAAAANASPMSALVQFLPEEDGEEGAESRRRRRRSRPD